jgi:hypothetical protein
VHADICTNIIPIITDISSEPIHKMHKGNRKFLYHYLHLSQHYNGFIPTIFHQGLPEAGGVLLKLCALNSYSSFPFSPVALPLLNQKNATAPINASAPTNEPITIPAMEPFESLDEDAGGADEAGPDSPAVGDDKNVDVVLGVGVMNSSLVTLKQGGFTVISAASTNVCSCTVRNFGQCT